MINELLADFYNQFIFEVQFVIIFRLLLTHDWYLIFGVIALSLPLLGVLMFYFWPNPYAKSWNWALWLLGGGIAAFLATYLLADYAIFDTANASLNNAFASPSSGYKVFAENLLWKFGLINGVAALVLGFIFSIFIKELSWLKMHIPNILHLQK